MTLKLLIPVLCNAVLAVILYLMEKKTPFGKVNNRLEQGMIGILFGALAAFSTEYGIDVNGAVMNVRDASPLCAGLIFGAPAGIIAGLIGGIYRYIAVLWGAGTYTRLACSISTVLAGVIAAALRKFMFDDKKPSWIYGIGVGLICEVLHSRKRVTRTRLKRHNFGIFWLVIFARRQPCFIFRTKICSKFYPFQVKEF